MANNPPQYRNLRPVFESPDHRVSTPGNGIDPRLLYGRGHSAVLGKGKKAKKYAIPDLRPGMEKVSRAPREIGAATTLSTTPKTNFRDISEESRQAAADQLRENKINDTMQQGVDGFAALAPYASNIINSFRKPPPPAAPRLLSPVSLGRVNYGASRAEAEQQVYGANQGVNVLGENQATAVRTANLVSGIKSINRINEAEANQNVQQGDKEAQINAGINAQNTGLLNNYNDQKVNQQMVDQQQRSANLSNAADKFVGINNENARRDLEATKYSILSKLYEKSGVGTRLTSDMETDPRTGIPIYKGKYGGTLKRYAAGGMLRKVYTDPPVGGVPVAKTLEADRTMGGAHGMSPIGTNMMRDEADILRKRAVFAQANPGIDPVAYAATQRATQGYVDPKSGDWFPTAYNNPGRAPAVGYEIMMAGNNGAKKFIEKKLEEGGMLGPGDPTDSTAYFANLAYKARLKQGLTSTSWPEYKRQIAIEEQALRDKARQATKLIKLPAKKN